MSTRKRRRRRSRVVRNVRRRRSPRRRIRRAALIMRRRAVRRNPRRRISRRRPRYAVAHVVRRLNPSGGSPFGRSTLGLAGGAAGMVIVGCYVPKLATKILPASTSVNTAHVVNDALKLGIGYAGYKLLSRRAPTVAQGVMVGAIISVVYDLFSMVQPMNSAPAAAVAPGPLASTTGTGGTGGTAASPAAVASNTPANTGTASTGTARYLGAPVRRRRMNAYLGAVKRERKIAAYLGAARRRRMQMGAYLQPGQPITSLIGPVSAARRTNRAGALGNIYTGSSIFRNAWAR